MTEMRWRLEKVEDYSDIQAIEAHGLYYKDQKYVVIAKCLSEDEDEDEDEELSWRVYTVLTIEDDGFAGLEHLDSFSSLDEAKGFADEMRGDIIRVFSDKG